MKVLRETAKAQQNFTLPVCDIFMAGLRVATMKTITNI